MKTLIIIIDPQGELRLETHGFTGGACREASKKLEQALGIAQSDQPTAELYQNSAAQTQARHQA